MSTIARTMNMGLFPVRVDPLKCVEESASFGGSISVSKFERLHEYLLDKSGEAQVDIQFGQDEQGTALLRGKCQAQVRMTCQRCMNPVSVDLSTDFELGIVFSDEQAKHLPKAYEPVVVDGEQIELEPVIEDELILSLPMFAYHPECGEHGYQNESEPEPEDIEAPNNPFSVLEQLKKK